jgi:carbamoyl-phosphate synthase large subunit
MSNPRTSRAPHDELELTAREVGRDCAYGQCVGLARNVLVTDGASGAALAVVRSLGRAGWRVRVGAGTRSARSRYVAATVELPDCLADPAGFADAVAAAAAQEATSVIVPCTDASVQVLWEHEDRLSGAAIMGGDRDSALLAIDKHRTLECADRLGFPTPAWRAPATVPEAELALSELGLPCVVKPRHSFTWNNGSLTQRRHVFIQSPEELPAALTAGADDDGALPILQAYVPGRAISVSAVLSRGRVLASIARETLSFHPVSGGTSVWKRTITADEIGVADALTLLRDLRYEGLAEVEYQIGSDGVPRLMEIGPRVHGWVSLACAAGVDLPLVAALTLIGEAAPEQGPYRAGVEMRWPAGELARIHDALSRRVDLPPGISRSRVLARSWPPWRPGMLYDNVDRSDLGPWIPERLRR